MAKLFFFGLLVLAAVAYCSAQRSLPCSAANESWNRCGRYCEPSCNNPRPRCPRITCNIQTAGCRCNRGFFREFQTCVRQAECSQGQAG